MSYGTVICSACRREVEQTYTQRETDEPWRHVEDLSPKCEGATVVYPTPEEPSTPVRGRSGLGTMLALLAVVESLPQPRYIEMPRIDWPARRRRAAAKSLRDHPCFRSTGPLPPLPKKPKHINRPPGWKRRRGRQ